MKTISITFWYALLTAGFAVALLLEFVYGTAQLKAFSDRESVLNTNTQTLQARLAALQSVRPSVTVAVSKVTNALPSENSSLFVTSQVRHFALDRSLDIKNISLSVLPISETSELGTSQLTFTATGTMENLRLFFDDILGASPVLSFETINVLASGESSIAQVSLNSFWAPFPTKLPSLDEPLVSLSQDETQLLKSVSELKEPVLITATDVASNSGQIKSNPFSPI